MKFVWRREEKCKGLASVGQGNRGWELYVVSKDTEELIASVHPVQKHGPVKTWWAVVVTWKNIQHYNSYGKQTWPDVTKLKSDLLASIKRKLAEIVDSSKQMRLAWRRRKNVAGTNGASNFPIYWELWYEGMDSTNETWVAAVFPKHSIGEIPSWWAVVHAEHGLPRKNTVDTQTWDDVDRLKENVKAWVAKRIKPCK